MGGLFIGRFSAVTILPVRRVCNGVALLSLVLCAATVTLWARTARQTYESFEVSTWRPRGELASEDGCVVGGDQGVFMAQVHHTTYQTPQAAADHRQEFRRWKHLRFPDLPSYGKTVSFVADRGFISRPNTADHYAILQAPLWLVTVITALPAAAWLASRWRRRRSQRLAKRAGLCPRCGYDLRASPNVCPECGAAAAGHSS